MKTQADIADLEAKIDFEALNHSLLDRLKRGEFGQRKTVHTLLDRIGDTLVALRRERVPLREIVGELKTHGLEVSESRVRAYLRSRGMSETKARARVKKPRSVREPASKTTPVRKSAAVGEEPPLALR